MIDIGGTKQLFADDELIDSMTHAFQELNPGRKHPANPLLDEDGTSIPGFALDECVPFQGDSVRHEIAWKGGPSCAGAACRLVRLSFRMRNARLYSFAFSD